jgi:hypothetical protein
LLYGLLFPEHNAKGFCAMNIPLYMILDALSGCAVENHIPRPYNKLYQGISILPDPPVRLDPTLLHFSTLSNIISIGGIGEGVSCICIRDRERDDSETGDLLKWLLIVEEPSTVGYIYYKIHSLFQSVYDWEKAMLDCIIRRDLASLVALSERFIGNPILVTDSALTPMASTPDTECEDLLWRALVRKTAPADPLLRQLLDMASASPMIPGKAFCSTADTPLSEHKLALRTIRINRTYNVYIVMSCSRKPLTKTVAEYYGRMCDKIETYVRSYLADSAESFHAYDTFIEDLIESRITDKEQIRERCALFGIKPDCGLRLCKILFSQSDNSSLAWAMEELAQLLPKARITLYGNSVLALIFTDEIHNSESIEQVLSGFASFFEQHNAICGASDSVEDISALHIACAQASAAIEYGQRVVRNKLLSDEEDAALSLFRNGRIFCYERYCIYQAADAGYRQNRMLFERSTCFRALAALWQTDKVNRLNNVKLLYIYLLSERSFLFTADLLHMHRNNVYYHIMKIRETLCLDLDNAHTRNQLLFIYTLLDVNGIGLLSGPAQEENN